ncbi:unnamed protein product [Rotaria magnacalcarata]
MTITTDDVNDKIQPNELLSQISNLNENNSTEKEENSSVFFDLAHYQQLDNLNLHAFTSINCVSFSHNVINFIRNANISKSHAQQLIDPIQSGRPQPNNLPNNYLDVFKLLSVDNLFMKRVLCINCESELSIASKKCPTCSDTKSERIAEVFDTLQETIFTRTYDRLSSVIDEYREYFTKQQMNNETNDIVYNQNYKLLYNSTNDRFITILLHVDGTCLSNNNKESLWLLSCSIIELPPAIRIRRKNNLVLSMRISKEQPNIYLWLTRCFKQLSDLKEKG